MSFEAFQTTLSATANTESEITIPTCREWSIQARTGKDLRLTHISGAAAGSTGPFVTIKAGGSYTGCGMQSGGSVFVACSTTSVVVELAVEK